MIVALLAPASAFFVTKADPETRGLGLSMAGRATPIDRKKGLVDPLPGDSK